MAHRCQERSPEASATDRLWRYEALKKMLGLVEFFIGKQVNDLMYGRSSCHLEPRSNRSQRRQTWLAPNLLESEAPNSQMLTGGEGQQPKAKSLAAADPVLDGFTKSRSVSHHETSLEDGRRKGHSVFLCVL